MLTEQEIAEMRKKYNITPKSTSTSSRFDIAQAEQPAQPAKSRFDAVESQTAPIAQSKKVSGLEKVADVISRPVGALSNLFFKPFVEEAARPFGEVVATGYNLVGKQAPTWAEKNRLTSPALTRALGQLPGADRELSEQLAKNQEAARGTGATLTGVLDVAAFLPGSGLAAKGLQGAKTLNQARKVGAGAEALKSVAGLAKSGGLWGAAYGGAGALDRGEDAMNVAKEAVSGGASGALTGAALGTAGLGIGGVFNKAMGLRSQKEIDDILTKREKDIFDIENAYVATRKAMDMSKDSFAPSRKRVASTDVLVGAADADGLVRTKQKGGAIDKYRELIKLDEAEDTVRANLEREAKSIDQKLVESYLEKELKNSGLEGKELKSSLRSIKNEIEGLLIRSSDGTMIPLSALHDAKISKTQLINFATEPAVQAERKALARAYKKIVEDQSALNVKEVNSELSKYYQDIELLEGLDGKKVKGGRLGRYFAPLMGNIIGSAAGSVLGPVGSALGAAAGGEIGRAADIASKKGTFGPSVNLPVKISEILEKSISESKKPRLALPPAPPDAPRKSFGALAPILLPARSQSSIDAAQSYNLGTRNMMYNSDPTMTRNANILFPDKQKTNKKSSPTPKNNK